MIKSIIKKILALWLVVYLTIVPPIAYAASAGGWAFSAFNVATSVVTAMKNGASASAAIAKSPIVSKIAKGIAGGVIAGAALPLAISQISGLALNAVDWVLDPANNAVKYKDPKVTGYYKSRDYPTVKGDKNTFCRNLETYIEKDGRKYVLDTTATSLGTSGGICQFYLEGGDRSNYWRFAADFVSDPNYYQSIPIPTLADKIYDNAKTDSASASIVNDAVREYVNEGSADTALDAAKADADATHNCGSGTHWSGSACVADTPTNPDTPTTPDTPFDPSSIIDAINSVFNAISNLFDAVMSIPDVINTAIDKVLNAIASITDVINTAIDDLLVDIKDFFQPMIDKVTDFFDWVKSDPPPPDDGALPETPITTDWQSQANGSYVNFGGSCPAPVRIPINYMGANTDLTISYTPFCQFATMIKPAVILSAYLAGLLIISGGRTKE